ncbi:helix-turn-helix domain-containing protein [Flavobacterium sp. '19STA2R22 D10 B1']|uniref:helix-turn-helix domain-containing protein n=1 Tax=Flavobacterium aerium TaxID=3037261 RepID=UPI00278BE980|nr:helix-turn-helix domain-containing protein [Flavobacterium sp. '19STA2R22 D10 B1']
MNENVLLDTISVICFLVIIVFLFFSVFLLTLKSSKKTSNTLLALFLIITVIDLSVYVYFRFVSLPPNLEMLRIRISFFKSPLWFLYILSLVYTDFRLRPIHLLHAIPYLISLLVLTPGFFLADETTKEYFFNNYNSMPESKFLHYLSSFQSLFYTIACIIAVRKYRKLLLENYTNSNSLSIYRFVIQLIVIDFALSSITEIKGILELHADPIVFNYARIIMLLLGLAFIFWLILKALYYPVLFKGVDSKLELVEKMITEKGPEDITTKEEISPENQALIHELKTYMEQQEPYLEPSLTIQDLSNQMKMPARDLSILINHNMDQHFFDFVNEYRIQKAMRILKDPERKDLTVLEILYEVGFNSKSSFNTYFKKYTHLTPTAYRNS